MPEQQTGAPAADAQGPGVTLHVRDFETKTAYANVCLLSRTREELILNFGMSFPMANREKREAELVVSNRIIMSPAAAKRLAIALSQTMQQYESQFGVIELEPRPHTPPRQA